MVCCMAKGGLKTMINLFGLLVMRVSSRMVRNQELGYRIRVVLPIVDNLPRGVVLVRAGCNWRVETSLMAHLRRVF